MRKQASASEIKFSIIKVINKINKNGCIYFEIDNELSDFNNDSAQSKRPIQRISKSDIVRKARTDREHRQHITRNDRRVSKKPLFVSGK